MTSWRRPGVTGLNVFQCHWRIPRNKSQSPVVTSIFWPSARVTTAFFKSDWMPRVPLNDFSLALADERIDRLHLDIEEPLDRRLYLGFRRIFANLEDDLICFRRHRRLFGDNRGNDHVVMMPSCASLAGLI